MLGTLDILVSLKNKMVLVRVCNLDPCLNPIGKNTNNKPGCKPAPAQNYTF